MVGPTATASGPRHGPGALAQEPGPHPKLVPEPGLSHGVEECSEAEPLTYRLEVAVNQGISHRLLGSPGHPAKSGQKQSGSICRTGTRRRFSVSWLG